MCFLFAFDLDTHDRCSLIILLIIDLEPHMVTQEVLLVTTRYVVS